jgi:hypothetical protein
MTFIIYYVILWNFLLEVEGSLEEDDWLRNIAGSDLGIFRKKICNFADSLLSAKKRLSLHKKRVLLSQFVFLAYNDNNGNALQVFRAPVFKVLSYDDFFWSLFFTRYSLKETEGKV